jgi:predicted nucleotidyltransferase
MKSIIASVKKFIGIFLLFVKNPLNGLKTIVDKAFKEFSASDAGKKVLEQAKSKYLTAANKDVLIDEVLAFLKDKISEITKDNPKLNQIIMDYLRGKIISILKK